MFRSVLSNKHPILRKTALVLCAIFLVGLVGFVICFPGRQTLLAMTLATGLGVGELQDRVEGIEKKAINREDLSGSEREFLKDLYLCFAKGGRLVAPESSRMMRRYLSGTGESLAARVGLFTRSAPVIKMMEKIKEQVVEDWRRKSLKNEYVSETFYMGDPNYFDSFVGLYFGEIKIRISRASTDQLRIAWRAEVPWRWPTYQETYEKYGDYHAQSFPLPNARSVIQGNQYCLYMDDGLGGHLAEIGLARSFLVFAEWEETLDLRRESAARK